MLKRNRKSIDRFFVFIIWVKRFIKEIGNLMNFEAYVELPKCWRFLINHFVKLGGLIETRFSRMGDLNEIIIKTFNSFDNESI